jgi:hypothetical protein
VVALPAAYLAAVDAPARSGAAPGAVAMAERIARALVPDATARGRVNKD